MKISFNELCIAWSEFVDVESFKKTILNAEMRAAAIRAIIVGFKKLLVLSC
jgi:hypothetical protein